MKKILSIILTLISLFQSFAQEEITINEKEIVIGEFIAKNESIKAKEFLLPDKIYNFQIDTTNQLLSFQIRGTTANGKWMDNKGSLMVFDLKSGKLKWKKKINYQISGVFCFQGFIIQSFGNKSISLDIQTGKELWETKNSICYINQKNKIALAYGIKNFSQDFENTLKGINLINGQEIWQRNINRIYGWNQVSPIDDQTLLISSSGLHALNLFDGKGWDFGATTGDKDYKETVAKNVLGVALGLMTGTFIGSTGYNVVTDICSNNFIKDSKTYFAGKKSIVCLDSNGKQIWRNELNQDFTSKALIWHRGDTLYHINYGFANMNGIRPVNYGVPFFAAYSITDGKEIFSKSFDKNKSIGEIMIMDDNILLVFDKQMKKISMLNGETLMSREITEKDYENLNGFTQTFAYIKNVDGKFIKLVDEQKLLQYLYNKNEDVMSLDNDLNLKKQFKISDMYFNTKNFENLKFLFTTEKNETWVIDENDNPIAKFFESGRSIIINDKIYVLKDDRFISIDLSIFK